MPIPDYDLYLGDKASLQGYRCRSHIRSSAPLVAPKFSTSSPGQTDLDLLKINSVDNLSGGMFQRLQQDSTMVARGVGIYDRFSDLFYPTLPGDDYDTSSLAAASTLSKAENGLNAFAYRYFRTAGSDYYFLYKFSSSGITNVSYATMFGISGSGVGGGIICVHKGYVFCPTLNHHTYRYNIAADTWADVSSTSFRAFFTVRGNLYAVGTDSQIYSITTETTATLTATAITSVGGSDLNVTDVKEYNGAAWLAKPDGLYRFDGLTCMKVLSLAPTEIKVWNGALYFAVGQWFYRFDGASVQKLQHFPAGETVKTFSSTSDYLFVCTQTSTNNNPDTDKFLSVDFLTRIYVYDGTAWSLWYEFASSSAGLDHCLIADDNTLSYLQSGIGTTSFTGFNVAKSWDFSQVFFSTDITTDSILDITSSEDDAGFPNIYKSFEQVEVSYSNMIADDEITVKFQLYDGKTWGAWQTLGQITSDSLSNQLDNTDFDNKLYKLIRINVYASALAANSTLAIRGFSWRYTLQPRPRWRWQINLIAYGNGNFTTRNNVPVTDDANLITNNIIKAIKQKTPIFMLSPDYGVLDVDILATDLTFVISGQVPIYTDPYSEYPMVALKNDSDAWELLRVSTVVYDGGTDKTTLTVVERGYLGITAAAAAAGNEFRLTYQVYVTNLLRDAPALDESIYDQQPTGESQIQREFIIELTEV